MKIKFLRNVTVDVARYPNDTEDKLFHRNDEVEVTEIIPISQGFSTITLPDQSVLVDVKNDVFKPIV